MGKVDFTTWFIRVTSPDCMNDEAQFFVQGMMNRMGVSYHKYGSLFDAFPSRKDGITNAEQRIQLYKDTGNAEWLIDAANYLLIESLAPSHPEYHFRSTDSDESPGSVLKDGSIDHGKVQ